MALLARKLQKIFGSTGGTGEFGAFGSDSLGSPTTTKDLDTIQSLSPYLAGLFAATNNANEPPRIQDINGLYLLFSSQLAYYFQNGIPEWHTSQEYYAGISYCQRSGIVYRSVTGTDGSPQTGHDPATDDGTYWEAGEASYRQLKFDLDRLGFSGYALYTDMYLRDKLAIARRLPVGFNYVGSVAKNPVAFSAAQSTANPAYPEYFPAIPRHDADHDISTTQVPQWVIDTLNAEKVAFSGVSDFTGTLAAGVITFADTTDNNKFLAWISEQALVARWYASGEAANYGSLGGLFTGTAQLSATIGGVNYAISGCAPTSHTLTLATYPANGTVSVAVYPGRIAGSTTSTRLRKISGEALVAAGDVTGEVVTGGARMGKLLSHWHSSTYMAGGSSWGKQSQANTSSTVAGSDAVITIRAPVEDGTNTLATGKSNDPRTAGMAVYTHLGVVLATNWT